MLCMIASMTLLLLLGRHAYDDPEAVSDALDEEVVSSNPEPRADAFRQFADIGASFLVLGIASGYSLALLLALDYRGVAYGLGGGLIASVLLLLLLRATQLRLTIDKLEVGVLLVTTLCYIVGIAGDTLEFTLMVACISCASWFVFRCFCGDLLMKDAMVRGVSSARTLASSKLAFNLGLPAGWMLACLLYWQGFTNDRVILYATIVVSLLVTVGFVRNPMVLRPTQASASSWQSTPKTIPQQRNASSDGGVVIGSQAYMERCMRIADLYQLSPREGEVLCYLARGRSARHISEDLMISEHTAKSHIYRIYQKMDIHTKQDLIDLVESEAFDR